MAVGGRTGQHRYTESVKTDLIPGTSGQPDRFRAQSRSGGEILIIRPEGAGNYEAHYEAARRLVWGDTTWGQMRRISGPCAVPDGPDERYVFAPQ